MFFVNKICYHMFVSQNYLISLIDIKKQTNLKKISDQQILLKSLHSKANKSKRKKLFQKCSQQDNYCKIIYTKVLTF